MGAEAIVFIDKNIDMLGAIIGDIVGSRFELRYKRIKKTDFDLFTKDSKFTDDTVLTVAVADWLMRDKGIRPETLVKLMQTYGRMYPRAGYSHATKAWLSSEDPQPYGSFTNGAAMRVSPVGWAFETLEETQKMARLSAEVSHNSEQGITAAQAVASAIFMARHQADKTEIKAYIEQTFDYDLSCTLEAIRPEYQFTSSCQGSVPEAIIAFLEGDDYESTIRLAISLGGDSDTQACIAGGIAEAYYGMIPKEITSKAIHKLPSQFRQIVLDFAMKTDYRLPRFR